MRKSRSKIDKSSSQKIALLKPLNLSDFTEENDPCFGKHHDLKTSECARCGDAEICSIITSQNLHNRRKLLGEKMPLKEFHDEPDKKAVKKFIRNKVRKGLSQEKIIKRVQKKWDIPKKKIINIILKQIKKLK